MNVSNQLQKRRSQLGFVTYILNCPRIITDQLEEDRMGGVCGTHVGEEECIQSFGVEI
jgi:hypothetical protein